MHITLESDYAVRITGFLAAENARIDAKKISESTGVSLRFALKILRKLVASGIVTSYKGAQGGYELAKMPAEITLRDVIDSIEGQYCLSRCLDGEFVCTHTASPCCTYQKIFREVSELVNEKLESYNFEEILKQSQGKE
ncbi:MAG: Rrf2 family transcriptional regulator [Oscillospiraceae bacterium]|nr:Rrf2 family transcriptional regulator [Oscillospiraceae bacterium]MBQ8826493.1 Rrf2 family transcriptional regulator [Oscillospiraceae bacterium]